MDERLFSPSTERNRAPIAGVLRRWLPATGTVLEIASGTGEHVSHFAAEFPNLVFQPSDPDRAARASVAAWTAATGATNVCPPLALDVASPGWEDDPGIPVPIAAILCINMIHISPWAATLGLMRGAGRLLASGGLLYFYGAYRRAGRHTAPSNAAFDASLQRQNPEWGVRELEVVAAEAEARGFALADVVEMPANNLSLFFTRLPAAPAGARAPTSRAAG
jgi:hypothetical protein